MPRGGPAINDAIGYDLVVTAAAETEVDGCFHPAMVIYPLTSLPFHLSTTFKLYIRHSNANHYHL